MGYRIVAADDNPVVLQLIASVLEADGHEVEAAPGGAEALLALSRNPPDLLLLDLQMPGLDGLDVLRVMAEQRVCPGLPVVMLTAEEDEHYVGRARELGAQGYLSKPVRARDLSERVRRMLEDADTLWVDDHHTLTRRRDGAAPVAPGSA